MRDGDEIVSALLPSGHRRLMQKHRAWKLDHPYRLLEAQPLTRAEKVAEAKVVAERERAEKIRRGVQGAWLSLKEKRSLFVQTGERFESVQQYQEWCKATGHRRLEPGENATENHKAFGEWARSGATGPSPFPHALTKSRPDVDIQAMHDRMVASGEAAHRAERIGLPREGKIRLHSDGSFERVV